MQKNNIHPISKRASILPTPRFAIINQMRHIAALIDGPVDTNPGSYNPMLKGCMIMPQASLLIAGSACGLGVLVSEVELLASHTGLDVLLLRYDPYQRTAFDLYMVKTDRWLIERYAHICGDSFWLIPKESCRHCVRITPWGVGLHDEMPQGGFTLLPPGLVSRSQACRKIKGE